MRIKRVRLKLRYNLILELQHVATILSMFIYPIILSRFDDLHQLSKLLFCWFLFRFFRSSRKLRLATARRWRCLTRLQWFAGILEAPDLLSYSLAWQVCWNMWPSVTHVEPVKRCKLSDYNERRRWSSRISWWPGHWSRYFHSCVSIHSFWQIRVIASGFIPLAQWA